MTRMPIVLVSTYPPEHCGVGRDAYEYAHALRRLRSVPVVGNRVPHAVPIEPEAEFAWRKDDPGYPLAIFRAVRRGAPEAHGIVHVMHHFFLYGGPRTILEFPLLLVLLRVGGYRVVVQFQSVIDPAQLGAIPIEGIPVRPGRLARAALRGFYRWCDRLADALVVCTASMRNLLVSVYGIAPDRVKVVPVGWREPPEALPPLPEGARSGPVVLFHGFLDATKGLDDLIDAVALARTNDPELRLVIAGEPSPHLSEPGAEFMQRLRDRAAAKGIADRVELTGYLDPAQLVQRLATADIVALPYTMRFSHGGSAVLSRVAGIGRPLVATRISRFSDELADGQTALLVPPSDPGALAAAIRRLRSEEGLGRRLGESLRTLAETRSWSASAGIAETSVYLPLESASGAA